MDTIFSTTVPADEQAIVLIEQMIDVDGDEQYTTESVTNGSGRVVGTEYHLTDEQAEFLHETMGQQAEDQA